MPPWNYAHPFWAAFFFEVRENEIHSVIYWCFSCGQSRIGREASEISHVLDFMSPNSPRIKPTPPFSLNRKGNVIKNPWNLQTLSLRLRKGFLWVRLCLIRFAFHSFEQGNEWGYRRPDAQEFYNGILRPLPLFVIVEASFLWAIVCRENEEAKRENCATGKSTLSSTLTKLHFPFCVEKCFKAGVFWKHIYSIAQFEVIEVCTDASITVRLNSPWGVTQTCTSLAVAKGERGLRERNDDVRGTLRGRLLEFEMAIRWDEAGYSLLYLTTARTNYGFDKIGFSCDPPFIACSKRQSDTF